MVDWEKIDQPYDLTVERAQNGERTNPESVFFTQFMGHEVQQVLKKLPEEFRIGIVLVDTGKLAYEEVRKVIGGSTGTVRSKISRGGASNRPSVN